MKAVLTFSFALLIAITSHHMASARALAFDAAGQIVLCTGHGVITVTVDRDGEPLETVHICPDCIPSQMAASPPLIAVAAVVFHMQILAETPVLTVSSPLIPTPTTARDPPAHV